MIKIKKHLFIDKFIYLKHEFIIFFTSLMLRFFNCFSDSRLSCLYVWLANTRVIIGSPVTFSGNFFRVLYGYLLNCLFRKYFISIMIILLSISGASFAGNSICKDIIVSVVNPTADALVIQGAKNTYKLGAHSSAEYKLQQKPYYTRCGRFDIKNIVSNVDTKVNNAKKMLIKPGVKRVSLRYNGAGKFDSAGIAVGDLDDYVFWHGLRSLLS